MYISFSSVFLVLFSLEQLPHLSFFVFSFLFFMTSTSLNELRLFCRMSHTLDFFGSFPVIRIRINFFIYIPEYFIFDVIPSLHT